MERSPDRSARPTLLLPEAMIPDSVPSKGLFRRARFTAGNLTVIEMDRVRESAATYRAEGSRRSCRSGNQPDSQATSLIYGNCRRRTLQSRTAGSPEQP